MFEESPKKKNLGLPIKWQKQWFFSPFRLDYVGGTSQGSFHGERLTTAISPLEGLCLLNLLNPL